MATCKEFDNKGMALKWKEIPMEQYKEKPSIVVLDGLE